MNSLRLHCRDYRRETGEYSIPEFLSTNPPAVRFSVVFSGFSSDVVGNLIGEDDQKRKLELVVETSRQVWG